MNKTIEIPDVGERGFHVEALKDYENAVQEFATDLLNEIERIEAGQNGIGKAPQITSQMVADGQIIFRRGPIFKKKRFWKGFLQLVLAIALVVFGVLLDANILTSYFQMVAAGLVFVIIVVSGTALYFKD